MMTELLLKNERWNAGVEKVAVVTGASSGIGLVTAQQLVRHGLIVIGLARRLDKMNDEMKNVNGPGQFHDKKCDISNEKNVIDIFSWIRSAFKSLHILLNNAAVSNMKTILSSSTEEIECTFKVNAFGLLYCTKQAILLMKESQSDAHIININSILGHKIVPNCPADVYPASKFAVKALSECLKNELTDSKIRVTSISPGLVRTEMFQHIVANFPQMKNAPVLQPEDLSNIIMYALGAPAHVEINEIILHPRAV